MTSALGGERLARLRAAKLTAVARRLGEDPEAEHAAVVPYPTGAGLVGHGRGWLLEESLSPRSAGRILLWALRHELHHLTAIIGGGAGGRSGDGGATEGGDADPELTAEVARRLAAFDVDVEVQLLVGTEPHVVAAAPLQPVGNADDAGDATDALVERWGAVFDRAGVELVVEGGSLHGEVLGLEVARVVDGILEVGVGRFDREITAMMHADLPTEEALARAAGIVRQHRYPGAPPHPMLDMGRERWLRRAVLADPAVIGCTWAHAIPTTVPLPNLRDPHPAAAIAGTAGGETTTVVCGAGLDVDLVPLAADVAASAPDSELLLIVAEGELLAPLRSIAEHLRRPARWVELPAPWAAPPAA